MTNCAYANENGLPVPTTSSSAQYSNKDYNFARIFYKAYSDTHHPERNLMFDDTDDLNLPAIASLYVVALLASGYYVFTVINERRKRKLIAVLSSEFEAMKKTAAYAELSPRQKLKINIAHINTLYRIGK